MSKIINSLVFIWLLNFSTGVPIPKPQGKSKQINSNNKEKKLNDFINIDEITPPVGEEVEPTIICPTEDNGQFPHPEFCDQFLNCWQGSGVLGRCEHGLLFNPINSACDYPANVNCENKVDSRKLINTITK